MTSCFLLCRTTYVLYGTDIMRRWIPGGIPRLMTSAGGSHPREHQQHSRSRRHAPEQRHTGYVPYGTGSVVRTNGSLPAVPVFRLCILFSHHSCASRNLRGIPLIRHTQSSLPSSVSRSRYLNILVSIYLGAPFTHHMQRCSSSLQ